MKACIYARTCRKERLHNTTAIPNQIAYARDIAARRGLTIHEEHIFTDVEKPGDLMPSCWAKEGEDCRPALSEMIAAIEAGEVSRIIVRRIEKLGTSSDVLTALRDLFEYREVHIDALPEQVDDVDDPRGLFAISILRPCIHAEDPADEERKEQAKAKMREEIARLQARIARLEAEMSEL